MTQEERIKNTKEWKSLNNIWQKCTKEQREALRGDFRTIVEFIKLYARSCNQDPNSYLDPLSKDAKDFVLDLLSIGEVNLYHSIMSVINNKRKNGTPFSSKEELIRFYFDKYSEKRPYLEDNRYLVEEVIDLCWRRSM